jgi:hypothetical protein
MSEAAAKILSLLERSSPKGAQRVKPLPLGSAHRSSDNQKGWSLQKAIFPFELQSDEAIAMGSAEHRSNHQRLCYKSKRANFPFYSRTQTKEYQNGISN